MELSFPIFVRVTVAYLLAALLYPSTLALKFRLERQAAVRWLKNTPVFTVYLPFLFSVGAGLMFGSFRWRELLSLNPMDRAVALILLVILFVLVLFAVLEDLKRPIVEPFMFKVHRLPLEKEEKIRAELKKHHNGPALRGRLLGEYRELAGPFRNLKTLWHSGSWTALTVHSLNALAGITVALLFWYLGLAVFIPIPIDRSIITVTIGIFCVWFPLRAYSEWYLYFYSAEHLKNYYAAFLIGLAAVFGYGFLIFQGKGLAKVFSIGVGGLVALIGIIGKLKPRWLGFLAEVIEDMPLGWFAACATLTVLSLMIMVGAMLRGS